MRTRPWPSLTTRRTASPPACGHVTATGHTACRAGSGPGSSGSIPSTRPISPSRSVATSNRASGATRGSPPSMAIPSSGRPGSPSPDADTDSASYGRGSLRGVDSASRKGWETLRRLGKGVVVDMTGSTVQASEDAVTEKAADLEPTQAEIDAWVAKERERRQAWLNGPTPEERDAYALRLRQRRLADTFDEGEAMLTDSVRRGMRLGREGQLAAEGAVALLYRYSRRTLAELVRAGREWEEETSLPIRRRRVSMDDEGS